MLKNIRGDFKAHGNRWTWGFWAMVVYRFGRWRYGIRWRWLRLPFSAFYKLAFFWIQGKGIELPCEVEVGRNFRIDHQGAIVISGYAVFGDNCVIRQGVTVGLARPEHPAAPRVGNNVDFGAGAKVLGAIVIGDHVRIGANAVVLQDVPSNSIAVGIPARILPITRGGEGGDSSKVDASTFPNGTEEPPAPGE